MYISSFNDGRIISVVPQTTQESPKQPNKMNIGTILQNKLRSKEREISVYRRKIILQSLNIMKKENKLKMLGENKILDSILIDPTKRAAENRRKAKAFILRNKKIRNALVVPKRKPTKTVVIVKENKLLKKIEKDHNVYRRMLQKKKMQADNYRKDIIRMKRYKRKQMALRNPLEISATVKAKQKNIFKGNQIFTPRKAELVQARLPGKQRIRNFLKMFFRKSSEIKPSDTKHNTQGMRHTLTSKRISHGSNMHVPLPEIDLDAAQKGDITKRKLPKYVRGRPPPPPNLHIEKTADELRTIADTVVSTIKETHRLNKEKYLKDLNQQKNNNDNPGFAQGIIGLEIHRKYYHMKSFSEKQIKENKTENEIEIQHPVQYLQLMSKKRHVMFKHRQQILAKIRATAYLQKQRFQEMVRMEKLQRYFKKIRDNVAHQQREIVATDNWLQYDFKQKLRKEEEAMQEILTTKQLKICTEGITKNRIDRMLERQYFLKEDQRSIGKQDHIDKKI